MAINTENLEAPAVGFTRESASIQQMRTQYDTLRDDLSSQIQAIQDNPLEVDASALVGQLNESFGGYKARAIESATASVKKASADLDTYFGSAQSDQRAGSRALIASRVRNSLVQQTYQAIGNVYQKHASDVISTELEGAKVNISAAATKASAIDGLLKTGASLYATTLSAVESDYQARLSASVEWAKAKASYEGLQIGQQLEAEKANLAASTSVYLKYGTRQYTDDRGVSQRMARGPQYIK